MKIAIHYFSQVVRHKGKNLRRSLKRLGVEIIPIEQWQAADLVVVYNIHAGSAKVVREVAGNKPIISLQEGMYALGWENTIPGMRSECKTANELNIMQFVWSNFEKHNYIKTGKKESLLKALGNPEYDDLFKPNKNIRAKYNIPNDAFVITHIDQYAHPRGGPNPKEMDAMSNHIQNLTEINKKIWVIKCLHPKTSHENKSKKLGRYIVRPFMYPVFDVLRTSNLIINLSSTEGITAAILRKPMIQYDISNSPDRWGFVEHGVAIRAIQENKLIDYTKAILADKLKLKPKFDYRKEYLVDGNAGMRTAKAIVAFLKN